MLAEWLYFIVITCSALTLSVVVARYIITLNIIDHPNHRSSHALPTPRCGGIAIICAYLMSCSLLFMVDSHMFLDNYRWLAIHGGMIFFALIGFYDDRYVSTPLKRLWLQIISIIIVLTISNLSLRYIDFPILGIVNIHIVGMISTMLWLIFYTNVFNFMDGLDGMAGGNAIINLVFIAIIASDYHDNTMMHLSFLLTISIVGFMIYNFPKGRLFLGDVGSYFLGFTLAIFPIILIYDNFLTPWLVIILYFHYLFDSILTLIWRLLRGKNITQAHREHLYQQLQQSGYSHMNVTVIYWIMATIQGILVLYYRYQSINQQALIILLLMVIYSVYAFWIYDRFKTYKRIHHD